MNNYLIYLKFGYTGNKLLPEDLKDYDKLSAMDGFRTYQRTYQVDAVNEYIAIARAMEIADKEGWGCCNYLYVINVIVEPKYMDGAING